MEYEHSPREMAEKLLEFNRDISDDRGELETEVEYVTELFERLQKSSEFNALALHLDIMFMDAAFDNN